MVESITYLIAFAVALTAVNEIIKNIRKK